MTTKNNFPALVKVSGLPFMLQGWNTYYYRSVDESDGVPTYILEDYTLYRFIGICGTVIYREGGIWKLRRNDSTDAVTIKYGDGPQTDPFGYWSMGMHVVPA